MATSDQIERFNRAFIAALRKTFNFDDGIVRRIMEGLREFRRTIAEIVLGSEFDQNGLLSIQNAISREGEFIRDDFVVSLRDEIREAVAAGASLIDEPFKAIGAEMTLAAVPVFSQEVLNAQTARGAMFITNLADEMASQINAELQLAIAGKQTPFQAMKRIGNIGIPRSTFNSVADRAETIVRTEMNSALNNGAWERAREINDRTGADLLKYWDATVDGRERAWHRQVEGKTNPHNGGTPIPMNQDFRLGGPRGMEKAKAPHDPRLSKGNSINCRCRLGVTLSAKAQV